MKKTLPALIVLSLLAVLFIPITVSAVEEAPEGCTLKHNITVDNITYPQNTYVEYENCPMCCLLNAIYNITDWIFVVLIALATVFVIIGALLLLFSAGSTEKIATGRNFIIYAAVGLAVGFLAKAVPGIVKLIVGIT